MPLTKDRALYYLRMPLWNEDIAAFLLAGLDPAARRGQIESIDSEAFEISRTFIRSHRDAGNLKISDDPARVLACANSYRTGLGQILQSALRDAQHPDNTSSDGTSWDEPLTDLLARLTKANQEFQSRFQMLGIDKSIGFEVSNKELAVIDQVSAQDEKYREIQRQRPTYADSGPSLKIAIIVFISVAVVSILLLALPSRPSWPRNFPEYWLHGILVAALLAAGAYWWFAVRFIHRYFYAAMSCLGLLATMNLPPSFHVIPFERRG